MVDVPPIPKQFQDCVTLVDFTESFDDNTISYTVQLHGQLSAQERGKLLLDLEETLCTIQPRIRVWHVPLGDRNTLRNFRGITVI